MLKNNLFAFVLTIFVLSFVGCSSKSDVPKKSEPTVEYKVLMQEREEKKVYDPVIKDNAPTQRAVVDMGVVLKTHITAYKDNNNNLIAGHDVFFWAVQPDFITTNSLPKEKKLYSYQGPMIDLGNAKFVDTDAKVETEGQKIEKEQEFDKKIDAFLKSQKN